MGVDMGGEVRWSKVAFWKQGPEVFCVGGRYGDVVESDGFYLSMFYFLSFTGFARCFALLPFSTIDDASCRPRCREQEV